jgi:hypothetical protein
LVGAAREARAGGAGYYAAALAAPSPPRFVQRVLAPPPGACVPARLHACVPWPCFFCVSSLKLRHRADAPLPRLWALGNDFAAAVASADELSLSDDTALALSALRDQALYGDVNIARPGLVARFATSVTAAEWCVRSGAAARTRSAALTRASASRALRNGASMQGGVEGAEGHLARRGDAAVHRARAGGGVTAAGEDRRR